MKNLTAALLASLALVAATLSLPGAAPAGAEASWGQVTARKQTIKKGCRDYRYSYRISVPGDAWMAEDTLVSPNGRKVATCTYDSDTRPDAGTGTWELCSATTKPGRYRIRLKVTSYDGYAVDERRTEVRRFRLARR